MNRTEKLFTIFVILLISFISYIFYIKKDEIKEVVSLLILKFKDADVYAPYDKTINHRVYNYSTVHETDNFKPKNINDIKNIYYTVLNNGWDEFTFYCPKDYKECADDVRKIINDKDYLSQINNFVNPYNSYKNINTQLTSDKEIYIKIDKLYTNEDIRKVNNKLNEIFKELNINKNNYSLNDIKRLHDYLINNTSYDKDYKDGDETISNKATGALFNNIALCSGYSDTFALMLDMLDIPNFRVSNIEHIWNVIKFNNEWRHIDVTWDDDEINKNNIYNFYYLTTNELIEKDNDLHTFNRDIYLELK